jgi:hypothetical protein
MTAAKLSPPARRRGVCLLLVLIGLVPLGLTGCAATRLRTDFTGFEKAYAETSNREMLLNLARLENRDPTYFFKIGQITSQYKMAATLSGTSSYALQSTNIAAGSPTGGGTPFVSYENDPIFNFIPVNDEANAQLLLKPVPAETFYLLYQQGWRVDQLVRLMVDRIELTRATAKNCSVETIRNVPPSVLFNPDGTASTDYLRDPDTLSSYTTFLRINAVVYWLQKHGYLLLRGTETFRPYDSKSGLDESSTNAPKAQDIVSASQKNAVWEHVGSQWLLGEKVFSPVFTLYPLESGGPKPVPNIAKIKKDMLDDPDMKELQEGPVLDAILGSLADGFAIEGDTNNRDSCTSTAGTPKMSAHLVMRSLIGLMAAAAQEQVPYDALASANPVVPNSRYLPPEQRMKDPPRFMAAVPAIERIPLLRLTGSSDDGEIQPIVQITYRGTNYRIADTKNPEVTDNQYWNRDVFRLINQLTSQLTVDISKFPLTEILQQ